MKKLLLLQSAAILFTSALFSQKENPWEIKSLYGSMNTGTTMNEFSLNARFSNRWMGFAGYNSGKIKSVNLPNDYRPGSSTFLFMESEGETPQDEFRTYDIGIRRIITEPSERAWLALGAGLSVISYSEQQFRRVQQPPQSSTSGYDIFDNLFGAFGISSTSSNYESAGFAPKKTGIGATLGLQANVNIFPFMGLNAGVSANINTVRTMYGAYIGLNIGLMRFD